MSRIKQCSVRAFSHRQVDVGHDRPIILIFGLAFIFSLQAGFEADILFRGRFVGVFGRAICFAFRPSSLTAGNRPDDLAILLPARLATTLGERRKRER
jgi:hypothetical protein